MRTPTLLLLVLGGLFAAGCPNRGTGPSSMEVGGACEGNNPFASCEELCVGGGLQMCTMACTADEDCPAGSVCTAFGTNREPYVCLPLCSAVPCEDYAQGYCCGPIRSSDNKTVREVCLTDSLTLSDGSKYPFVCEKLQARPVGSCSFSDSQCFDYYFASERDAKRTSCTSGGYRWSDGPCATAGRIASCDVSQRGAIIRFYPGSGWTEEHCSGSFGGYWIPGGAQPDAGS